MGESQASIFDGSTGQDFLLFLLRRAVAATPTELDDQLLDTLIKLSADVNFKKLIEFFLGLLLRGAGGTPAPGGEPVPGVLGLHAGDELVLPDVQALTIPGVTLDGSRLFGIIVGILKTLREIIGVVTK